MPFDIIGHTGPGTRQLVGFVDRSTGRGYIWGEFGARHCNQWELNGVRMRQHRDAAFFQITLGRLVSFCRQTPFFFNNICPQYMPVSFV